MIKRYAYFFDVNLINGINVKHIRLVLSTGLTIPFMANRTIQFYNFIKRYMKALIYFS